MSYTLVTDGTSDRLLLSVVNWQLSQLGVELEGQFCPGTGGLAGKLRVAIRQFPCALLIVHRDSESATRSDRLEEIETAIRDCEIEVPYVCLVPVRMMEAWYLFDETRIRRAAGNPNGTVKLQMPPVGNLEKLLDPKTTLHELLTTASELRGRRRKKFRPEQAVHRLAELVADFSPVSGLPAFQSFSGELAQAVQRLRLEGRI